MNAQSFLMIPDSVSDRIVLFDPDDGSLVDDNFIDGSDETGLGIFQTPLNAVQVNQEIWVSDQVADAIFRFDLQGNYLSIVGDNDGDGDTDGLDNIRGLEFINGLVYFNADDGFANIVRAAYELDNGNIIWSGGDGVVVTDPDTGEDTDIYTVNTLDFRPSARYIEPLIIPESGDRNLQGAIFFSDQTLDQLYLSQDISGDGDANDLFEVNVYFDETNASGLANPTQNVFTILQSRDVSVFYGDGDTDSVYCLTDSNQDGDALDAEEVTIWFDATNAEGLSLQTPNGLGQGSDGAIYIVEADTVSTPDGDFVYRTEDINGAEDSDRLVLMKLPHLLIQSMVI